MLCETECWWFAELVLLLSCKCRFQGTVRAQGTTDCIEQGSFDLPANIVGDGVADTAAMFYDRATHNRDCNVARDTCPNLPGSDPNFNVMNYMNDICRVAFTREQRNNMDDSWALHRLPGKQVTNTGSFLSSLADIMHFDSGMVAVCVDAFAAYLCAQAQHTVHSRILTKQTKLASAV